MANVIYGNDVKVTEMNIYQEAVLRFMVENCQRYAYEEECAKDAHKLAKAYIECLNENNNGENVS